MGLIHDSAYIDWPCKIGSGTRIWHFCHVMEGAVIGRNCTLGQNVHVAGGVVIGDNVRIQNNVSLYDGVVIDDDVFLGPSCVFTNVKRPGSGDQRNNFWSTIVEKGAVIGANATIICGVTIGKRAFVGAGAVVTKDVPEDMVVTGVPARPISKIEMERVVS